MNDDFVHHVIRHEGQGQRTREVIKGFLYSLFLHIESHQETQVNLVNMKLHSYWSRRDTDLEA